MCAPRRQALEGKSGRDVPGWHSALDDQCASAPQLRRYASDPREGDCVRFLPSTRHGRALFLGNALALLPCLLAELFDSVVVADSNAARLALAQQRKDEETIENMTCVLTDSVDHVPPRLGHFHLVALGEERPDSAWSMPITDAAMPSRLAGSLVRGGCLMYAVRFPPLRAFAAAARPGWSARMPLFYRAHARALARTGFAEVKGYGRRPDMRPYQVHVPLDEPAIVSYWIRSGPRPARPRAWLRRSFKKALGRLGAADRLFSNYLVVARRG
jgi:hypothetical protein